MGTVSLANDNKLLNEVVVTTNRPVHKLTREGLQTQVSGTILSKLGSGEDVLSRIPMLIHDPEKGFTVFGKGTPLIYINGRLMRDASELQRINSEDIESVEVITNPGAKYDASVKAVVKIKTRRAVGEGFGGQWRSTYSQGEKASTYQGLTWNYRHKGLDIFGNQAFSLDQESMDLKTERTSHLATLWNQKDTTKTNQQQIWFYNTVGVNYVFNNSNSVGVRYQASFRLKEREDMYSHSYVTADGAFYDALYSESATRTKARPYQIVNAYYNGKVGGYSIDWNFDFLHSGLTKDRNTNEQSMAYSDRILTTRSEVLNSLIATKLDISRPLWGGEASVGVEFSKTRRADSYTNTEGYVANSDNLLKETNLAPYIGYSRRFGKHALSAGLRYEKVRFRYYSGGAYIPEQSRSYGNLFPSISWQTQFGKVGVQASYSIKAKRPTYDNLSSSVTYVNRFLYSTGNPLLKNTTVHSLSALAAWKQFQFVLDYTDSKNGVVQWAKVLSGSTNVNVLEFINVDRVRNFSVATIYAKRVGVWSPQVTAAVQKQWLTIDGVDYSSPVLFVMFNNTVRLPQGWALDISTKYTSMGHSDLYFISKNTVVMDVSVMRSFLAGNLDVKVSGKDLFHQQGAFAESQMNQLFLKASQMGDSRYLGLSLTYKFNTVRSKYKGTGAGKDQKSRL